LFENIVFVKLILAKTLETNFVLLYELDFLIFLFKQTIFTLAKIEQKINFYSQSYFCLNKQVFTQSKIELKLDLYS